MTTKPTKPDPKEPLTDAVVARNRVTGPGSADYTSEQLDELMAKIAIATPKPLNVPEAINQVMRLVGAVPKGGPGNHNAQGKGYDFRGIDRVVNAVSPAMQETGLVIRPHKVLAIEYVDVLVGSNRTPMASTRVRVRYRITAPDGSHEYGEAPGEAFDSGDKGTAKAMSVALRIFLLQTFMLPTTERDPDEDTYERSPSGRVHGRDPEDQDTGQPVPPQTPWREWFDLATAKTDPTEAVEALAKLLTYAEEHNAPAQVISAIDAEIVLRRDPGPLPAAGPEPERTVDVHASPVHEEASRGTREWWEKHGKPVTEVDQKVQQEAAQFTTRLNKVLAQVGGPNMSVLDAMYQEAVRKCDEHPESEWAGVLGRVIDECNRGRLGSSSTPDGVS